MQHALGSRSPSRAPSEHGRSDRRPIGQGHVLRADRALAPGRPIARVQQTAPRYAAGSPARRIPGGGRDSASPPNHARTLPHRVGRLATSRGVREIAIVGVAVYLYFFVRGLMHGQEARAFAHARWLVDLEQRLGFFWEPTIQDWALRHDWLGTAANWVYIWGHWPVIIGTLVWLLVRHREQYPVFRNAMLISGGIGLVCFLLWPMAPPRFLGDLGFVDTVTLHSNAYRVLQPPSLTNQYAAMPSLHCGWDLLMGIAIATHASRRWIRALGIVLPFLMISATVLTANHYILDGIVGMSLATFGFFAARFLVGFPNRAPVGTGCEKTSQSRPAIVTAA